jgi:hypothetical protein
MKQILLAVFLIITVNFCSAQTVTASKTPSRPKYNIHLKNNCHWWIASSTKWVEGYVVVTPAGTQYVDIKGHNIDNSEILGYNQLQTRNFKRTHTDAINTNEICSK